jgi:polysaccharide export outer membrane protein
MKVAIWCAWLALTGAAVGAIPPQQTPPSEPSQQGAPPAQAGSPMLPAAGADSNKPVTPAAPETDPAKMGQPAAKPATNPDPSYVIGAEDVLNVQVWGDPRLSGSILVRPDGRISLALIGEITASGLTPGQLENAIAEVLREKDILRKPQITVQVTQINSKKYYIQGEVLKPGTNPLVVPTTILEALVNAGGFKDFANTKKIEVIRGKERFKFNYKDVIHGKHTEQNIYLKPGDIIIVP